MAAKESTKKEQHDAECVDTGRRSGGDSVRRGRSRDDTVFKKELRTYVVERGVLFTGRVAAIYQQQRDGVISWKFVWLDADLTIEKKALISFAKSLRESALIERGHVCDRGIW